MTSETPSANRNRRSKLKSLRTPKVALRIDWPRWLRIVQRKRRKAAQRDAPRRASPPPHYFAIATLRSFQIEGIPLNQAEFTHAMARGWGGKSLRSRTDQRVRNHVAILRRIELSLKVGATLTSQTVLRWYTLISCGLSLAALDDSTMARLENIVRRINSPQFRLQPAITEIAHVHAQLNSDPLVPSFNGILARLLLQYHLGRCGLPRVVFDPTADSALLNDEPRLLKRILEIVEAAYEIAKP
jgi:hypothetical protein